MNSTQIAGLLVYIAALDRRNFTPTNDQDRAMMLQAWTNVFPEWVTPELAKRAVEEYYRSSHWPIMPADIIDLADGYRQAAAREARRAAGVTKTVNDTAPQIESARAPMPAELKEKLARQRKTLRHEMKRKSA